MPKTYIAMNRIGALQAQYLSYFFEDFFVELLPESLFLSMIDAFLFEAW